MLGLAGWARDVLLSRGALVEEQQGEALRALLPPEVASALGSGDWLSLDFGASAGADDAGDWLERLRGLLAAGGEPAECVAGARLRSETPVPPIDAASVLH